MASQSTDGPERHVDVTDPLRLHGETGRAASAFIAKMRDWAPLHTVGDQLARVRLVGLHGHRDGLGVHGSHPQPDR